MARAEERLSGFIEQWPKRGRTTGTGCHQHRVECNIAFQTLPLCSMGTIQTANDLENNVVKLTFTNKGGRYVTAILKDYNRQDGKPLMLFDEKIPGMNSLRRKR